MELALLLLLLLLLRALSCLQEVVKLRACRKEGELLTVHPAAFRDPKSRKNCDIFHSSLHVQQTKNDIYGNYKWSGTDSSLHSGGLYPHVTN
jgi:hypothetical protein